MLSEQLDELVAQRSGRVRCRAECGNRTGIPENRPALQLMPEIGVGKPAGGAGENPPLRVL